MTKGNESEKPGEGRTAADSPASFFGSDQPIADAAHDQFTRTPLAHAIADQLSTAPADHGFVVGLFGPWGSGKTSLLNLVYEDLRVREGVVPVRFNPWLFSGAEQLVFRFFQQIGAELRLRPDKPLLALADRVADFGETLGGLSSLPYVGLPFAVISTGSLLLKKRRKTKSAIEQREELTAQLQTLGRRVVVLIDDIDRLPPEEVRDIMRLVRLTADFPNMLLLVAFDRERVEQALSDSPETGRAYLAKIIQVSYDVPVLRKSDLTAFLLTGLERIVANREVGPLDQRQWENLFHQGIRPLFESLRDVKRYLNALPVTLDTLGDEVGLADALALEALRVQVPDIYRRLPENVELLTSTRQRGLSAERRKENLESLLAAGGPHRGAAENMVKYLFPASSGTYGAEWQDQWSRDRRVAHERVLRFHLERSLPAGIMPARSVHEVVDQLGEPDRLEALISALDPATLEHLLARLEDYEDVFSADIVEPSLPVLMNQQTRLREGRGAGMFDSGADMALSRVALRFLKRVPEEAERERIIQAVLPRIRTLSARLSLLDTAGHRKNVGTALVSEKAWTELVNELRRMTLAAEPERLAVERNLAVLVWRASDNATEGERDRIKNLLKSSAVVLRLLRSGLSESHAGTIGEAAQARHWRLAWDEFEEAFGQPEWTRAVEETLGGLEGATLDERDRAAVDMAERYLSGWRPEKAQADDD